MEYLNFPKIRDRFKQGIFMKKRFSREKFFYEKSSYLKNGISLTEALNISADSHDVSLREKILEGEGLSDAMASLGVFFKRELSLVRLAEETGDLSGAFSAIHATLKEERELGEKIISVLIYPMLLLVSALIFLTVSVYYIVPPLHTMLLSLGTENMVLASVNYLSRLVPAPVMVLLITAFICLMMRKLKDREVLFNVVLGCASGKYREMRFIGELALLSGAGMDILECLRLLHAEGYPADPLSRRIKEGEGLRTAFSAEGYSSLLTGYLALAEETGDYVQAFSAYAAFQKVYFTDLLRKKTAMIEPASILFMGIVVFLISFIIMIPMLDAYENL